MPLFMPILPLSIYIRPPSYLFNGHLETVFRKFRKSIFLGMRPFGMNVGTQVILFDFFEK